MAIFFTRHRSKSPGRPNELLRGEKGNYELKQLIHRGGHGEIWAAMSSQGAEVAVKLMRPDTDLPESSFHLEREILLDCRFHVPSVVRGLDFGTRGREKSPFLVMEKLGNCLAPSQAVTWSEYKPNLKSLLEALSLLHANGIVHHDVKPSNIVVASKAPLRLKFCDFSAATKEGVGLARNGLTIGTGGYRAPADRAGPRNEDFWGLGVTSIQVLCGSSSPIIEASKPFEASFIEQVRTAYQEKHGAILPLNAALFLRLLFDAYNPAATADRLLAYLAACDAGQEDFPHLCPLPKPPALPVGVDSDSLAVAIARRGSTNNTARSPDRSLGSKPAGLRSPWRLLAIVVLFALVGAAATIGIYRGIPSATGVPAQEALQLPANGGWILQVDAVPLNGKEPWSWKDQLVTLEHREFARLESENNSGKLRYADGRVEAGSLWAKLSLTEKSSRIRDVTPSLQGDVYTDITILSDRAVVMPTIFELRLPLAEVMLYVNRQTNKKFAALGMHWELLDPTLDFVGNRVRFQMDARLTGFPDPRKVGKDKPAIEVQGTLRGECVYELKEAGRSIDQEMALSLKLESLQCKETSGLDHALVENSLKALLRLFLFDKTHVIHPFRDSDGPVKSLLEHVTVHELTITDFGTSVVVRGNCRTIKRDPNAESSAQP